MLQQQQQTADHGCKSRVALILIDGLGDVSIPSLGGLTPVAAAATPNLDALARAGVNGLMDPVEPGLACGSDTAHLSLIGYNPRIYYRGRGSFESLGAGFAMSPGDIAFKAIDNAGHDKAIMLKVKAFEAVDKMIGQLAHLLWQAESGGNVSYSIRVTGDHSTPVEYGDHSFEPVPFSICCLKDFVKAIGGKSIIAATSMDTFKLPHISDERFESPEHIDVRKSCIRATAGDPVTSFSELAAARGCLGRFQGSEMMGIIKNYLQLY